MSTILRRFHKFFCELCRVRSADYFFCVVACRYPKFYPTAESASTAAVAAMAAPNGLVTICDTFIFVPADDCPASKPSVKQLQTASSISAIIMGIANTSRFPPPTAFAVFLL